MGFIAQGLGPEIVRMLRKASAEIQQGRGRAESTRWFGDTAEPWMTRLPNALNRMASVINVTGTSVGFESLNDRSGAFDIAWNRTPQYRPLGTEDTADNRGHFVEAFRA